MQRYHRYSNGKYHNEGGRRHLHAAWLVVIDVLLIGVALVIFSLFHHVLPRDLSASAPRRTMAPARTPVTASAPSRKPSSTPASDLPEKNIAATSAPTPEPTDAPGEFGIRFADKFTNGEVIQTDTLYQSPTLCVSLSTVQQGEVTYLVQDIYVRSIQQLRTAFAGDAYGIAINDWVKNIAQDNQAIAAINGDYYGIGEAGVVIRNGVLYREQASGDVCVLFNDGVMAVYEKGVFDAEMALDLGAFQAWDFGPSLLSPDGEALSNIKSRVSGLNPRTAIGYYEPGHYCFVVVDGRQEGYSIGMTLEDLSQLFASLGCQAAYNLDGGQSSVMVFQDKVVSSPYNGGRKTSDIVFVCE